MRREAALIGCVNKHLSPLNASKTDRKQAEKHESAESSCKGRGCGVNHRQPHQPRALPAAQWGGCCTTPPALPLSLLLLLQHSSLKLPLTSCTNRAFHNRAGSSQLLPHPSEKHLLARHGQKSPGQPGSGIPVPGLAAGPGRDLLTSASEWQRRKSRLDSGEGGSEPLGFSRVQWEQGGNDWQGGSWWAEAVGFPQAHVWERRA